MSKPWDSPVVWAGVVVRHQDGTVRAVEMDGRTYRIDYELGWEAEEAERNAGGWVEHVLTGWETVTVHLRGHGKPWRDWQRFVEPAAAIAETEGVGAVTYIDRDGALVLPSQGLLSKFGLNDGDEPDALVDILEAEVPGYDYVRFDWHAVLCRLVRGHLLPALQESVEVVEIDTNHNPIRAARINGLPAIDYAEDLTPVAVRVPKEAVLAAVRDQMAREASA